MYIYILTKMSVLTCFSKVRLFITVIIFGIVLSLIGINPGIKRILANVIAMIDQSISSVTIYFMMEQNDEEYLKYIGNLCVNHQKQIADITEGDINDQEHHRKLTVTRIMVPQLEMKHYQSNSVQSQM